MPTHTKEFQMLKSQLISTRTAKWSTNCSGKKEQIISPFPNNPNTTTHSLTDLHKLINSKIQLFSFTAENSFTGTNLLSEAIVTPFQNITDTFLAMYTHTHFVFIT